MNLRHIGILVSFLVMLTAPTTLGMFFDEQPISAEEAVLPSEQPSYDKDNLKQIVITMYDRNTGGLRDIDFEEYVCSVVAAEVPYTFEKEALKAMSVAVRSYCLRRINAGENAVHMGGDVCNDPAHCLAYVSYDELISKKGEYAAEVVWNTVRNAVEETRGEVLYYEGAAADCLFHSGSYEKTESAQNVWGAYVPYLVSVNSPEEEILSENSFTPEEFRQRLTDSKLSVVFPDECSDYIKNIEINQCGRVQSADICGVTLSGKRIREIFGLKSTDFDLTYSGEAFVFKVQGYGHGVGMSQYGCNELAKEGKNYREILSHYYVGTELGVY